MFKAIFSLVMDKVAQYSSGYGAPIKTSLLSIYEY